MISIWNRVVEDGEVFPQEELLNAETDRTFFAAQSCCGVAEVGGDVAILDPNHIGRSRHTCNASYAVVLVKDGGYENICLYYGELRLRDMIRPNAMPALVPEELFNRVQEKLAKNKKAPARNKAEESCLLTTKLS